MTRSRLCLIFAALCASAQEPGPTLAIEAASGRHPISPDIYGINFYWNVGNSPSAAVSSAAADIRPTVRRWGGNNTSTYHWKFDVTNLDADWFYEVLPDTSVNAAKLPEGSTFNKFADQARMTGGRIYGTIPVLGWLPKARREACSFDVAKYGRQCKQDPYAKYHPYTCGNGVLYDSACGDESVLDGKAPKTPVYVKNDPNDVYAQFDESFEADWIRYLVSRYGKASQGGVAIWALGNEPIWWDSTHRDIHPDPYTYDELLGINMRYARAIKSADPTALVAGPVADNWASLFFSKKDITAGWARGNYWSNPVDRNAHGGMALMPWYLQQFRDYERQNGVRLLDYLDLHAYIQPGAVESSTRPEPAPVQSLRLDATREFWDPTYVVNGDYWIKDVDKNGAPVAPRFIPRVREMIDQYYPGTKLAITEYSYGGLDTLNGALAQADLLGIFGREGVDLATLWGPPKPSDPAAFAFKIYRNYDGLGGAFGESGVQASSEDQGKLAVYAAVRNDGNLTAVVINKTGADLSSRVKLSGFSAARAAQSWLYSGSNLNAIMQQPDIATGAAGITATFPANSITMLVVPPANSGPKPSVAAVVNAASYAASISPGQVVTLFGKGIGPEQLVSYSFDDRGMVSTVAGGARVLFDGVPAPVLYASATQVSAVVPYFGAIRPTTHVQAEYGGVRSDPLEMPVSATAPGLFAADFSGKGQGAILNEDGGRNSAAAPAKAGSIVVLWGTGEGVTDPPGVDGRAAVDVVPKPVASVAVEIGGVPASIEYAGAAPGNIPGLIQINARVPAGVAPANAAPVRVKIGSQWSQDGLTIAVR